MATVGDCMGVKGLTNGQTFFAPAAPAILVF